MFRRKRRWKEKPRNGHFPRVLLVPFLTWKTIYLHSIGSHWQRWAHRNRRRGCCCQRTPTKMKKKYTYTKRETAGWPSCRTGFSHGQTTDGREGRRSRKQNPRGVRTVSVTDSEAAGRGELVDGDRPKCQCPTQDATCQRRRPWTPRAAGRSVGGQRLRASLLRQFVITRRLTGLFSSPVAARKDWKEKKRVATKKKKPNEKMKRGKERATALNNTQKETKKM